MNIVVVSGGFDPLHSGHISYLESAASFGDRLIVCLNSDSWLSKKKGKPFMSFHERKIILESLKWVHSVVEFDDSDGSSIDGLIKIKKNYPDSNIFFCNGGDRNAKNIPEIVLEGIKFIFGVGGEEKLNSSSEILENWNRNIEERSWGFFKILSNDQELKVKELTLRPFQGISFQRHMHRSEHWFIVSGVCEVFLQMPNESNITHSELTKGDSIDIPIFAKHQLINSSENDCRIIEVQTGAKVIEEDIERFFYYPKTPESV